MKNVLHSLSLGAGALALFALAACQSNESPTQTADTEIGPTEQLMERRAIPEGRKATDEEVARFLSEGKAVNLGAPAADALPLSKAAALAPCMVNFNNVNALAALPNHANQGNAFAPFYNQTCNGSYTMYSSPLMTNSFKLVPEYSSWCAGPGNLIGYKDANSWFCTNHSEGKYWPRTAGNSSTTQTILFYVKNSAGTLKNFDLKSISIHTGTAEIMAWRPGIGWWYWYPLNQGNTYVWPAGTVVGEIRVYEHGKDGLIRFDNIEIAIHP